MEYITISDSRIKLVLGPGDVEAYDLDPVSREGEDGKSFLSGFRKIMRDVKRNTGFDAEGKRVLVRYFYGKDGGCELYITKLPDSKKGGNDPAGGARNLYGTYLYKKNGEAERSGGKKSIYRFSDLSDFLGCCGQLRRTGRHGPSEAYFDRGGREYYLVLDGDDPTVPEYNGAPVPERRYYFIREHFKKFSKDPLSDLFGL